MKIEDFEKAIDALACEVVKDEVRLRKGQVHEFLAHKGRTLILWDSAGRAFSVRLDTLDDGDEVDHDIHDHVVRSCYERDVVFDLKFDL